MLQTITAKITHRLQRVLHYDFWNVGVIDGSTAQLVAKKKLSIKWYKPHTMDAYVADPFIYHKDGTDYIFVEEFDYHTQKGHISVIYDWNKAPQKIIDESHHLSYPFLIEEDGNLYMLPEASASGKLYLYRCESFPFRWKRERVLINEPILDPTIFNKDGKYWMFYAKPQQSSSELYLKYSDSLLGEWKDHPSNPVKVASKICRPAGPVFSVGDSLFRPSQDSTTNYGDNIILNKITALSTSDYLEEQVHVISPFHHKPYTGMHHVAHTSHSIVIDGRKTLREFKGVMSILRSVVRRLT